LEAIDHDVDHLDRIIQIVKSDEPVAVLVQLLVMISPSAAESEKEKRQQQQVWDERLSATDFGEGRASIISGSS
jgi:hypothetical protein